MMTETLMPAPVSRCQTTPTDGSHELLPISLALELQSLTALMTVMTTVARLGCQVRELHAAGQQAVLGVLAPRRVAHRLLPCLGELVEVLRVDEVVPGMD